MYTEQIGESGSQWDTYYIIDERPEQVLVNHIDGLFRKTDGIRDATQVRAHKRHLSHIHSHIGALAHSNADIGASQCLRVVNAVAHHCHVVALLLQLFHQILLVLRHHLALVMGDMGFLRDRCHPFLLVATHQVAAWLPGRGA